MSTGKKEAFLSSRESLFGSGIAGTVRLMDAAMALDRSPTAALFATNA